MCIQAAQWMCPIQSLRLASRIRQSLSWFEDGNHWLGLSLRKQMFWIFVPKQWLFTLVVQCTSLCQFLSSLQPSPAFDPLSLHWKPVVWSEDPETSPVICPFGRAPNEAPYVIFAVHGGHINCRWTSDISRHCRPLWLIALTGRHAEVSRSLRRPQVPQIWPVIRLT